MIRLAIVDYLRGFAIFTIVLMHCVQGYLDGSLDKAISFGGAGVHVFIFCSGFGLYLSHLNKPLRYMDFLKKRFLKVYVPYVIAVALYVLWNLFSEGVAEWRAVASHVFLYKMFNNELDVSICYPFWFISTIIQFYVFFPLIIKLLRVKGGLLVAFIISLLWAAVVGALGYESYRPWGSFFLQYLWEFVLGMWLAEKVKTKGYEDASLVGKLKFSTLVITTVVGMAITGLMAWNGGYLKLFNDIPSFVGYISALLLIYKIGIKFINRFFESSSRIGYELYLVHCLVFEILHYAFDGLIPVWVILALCIFLSYAVAYAYSFICHSLFRVRE